MGDQPLLKTIDDGLPHHWTEYLDDRQRKHVDFARHYTKVFAHGAPGHLDLLTIAALAELLDGLIESYGGDRS